MTKEKMYEIIDGSPFPTVAHVRLVVEMYSHLVPPNGRMSGNQLGEAIWKAYGHPMVDFHATVAEQFVVLLSRVAGRVSAVFTKGISAWIAALT